MNIQTKFNIGDKVCTIDKKTMKVREFEVESIGMVITKEKQSVILRAKGDSVYDDGYDEKYCFTNENELLDYITTKEAKK